MDDVGTVMQCWAAMDLLTSRQREEYLLLEWGMPTTDIGENTTADKGGPVNSESRL